MARRRTAELVEARSLSPSVRGLTFRTTDGRAVGHVAGQYVDLIVPTPRGLAFRRSYSIASGPGAVPPDVFEIAVTRVERGPTSEALHSAAAGAVVELEGPKGTFVRQPQDRAHPALFVATGTGLAPLRAMLAEEVRETQGPPLLLLFGCRTAEHVLWGDELREWARRCARFRMEISLSRPPSGWTGRSGYVQQHVEQIAGALRGPHAYVCGLGAMVDEVVTRLERGAGLAREAVHYEVYD